MSDSVKAEMIQLLPRLRAFARGLTRSWEQADDLVQQTCEKALRNSGSFQPGTRMDAWMFRIMRNAWIDVVRARRETEELDIAGDDPALAGEDGRRTIEARLHLAAVRRAIDTLPEEQRSILLLVCIEGMRYREVAAALDIPEGTVMSRLARARLALGRILDAPQAGTDHKGHTA
ncbi:MAG: RNA polymerase sigma factor [Rhodobacterales bacterium]|nr:RNA polymerase sigma factor [Rhodobacterales bacterium]MDX5501285.1 RNA polymerase sigma factor [Rhodobacterales bacterium]